MEEDLIKRRAHCAPWDTQATSVVGSSEAVHTQWKMRGHSQYVRMAKTTFTQSSDGVLPLSGSEQAEAASVDAFLNSRYIDSAKRCQSLCVVDFAIGYYEKMALLILSGQSALRHKATGQLS